MRCPFLNEAYFDCNERLYYTIEALESHLFDHHGVGIHEIEDNKSE
jgi:hypothetical protein